MRRVWMAAVVVLFLTLSFSDAGAFPRWEKVKGDGPVIEETREVGDFHRVSLATVGTLHIETGEKTGLRIRAEENLHEYLEIEISDGELVIRNRRLVSLRPKKEISYYLTVRELDTIHLSGSGNIIVEDIQNESLDLSISGSGNLSIRNVKTGDMAVEISGSGNMRVERAECADQTVRVSGSGDVEFENLSAREMSVRISGSGGVKINGGRAQAQDVELNGSGDYRAGDLKCSVTDVEVHGSGSVLIHADEILVASLHGSGDVRYFGNPHVTKDVHGSGKLKH